MIKKKFHRVMTMDQLYEIFLRRLRRQEKLISINKEWSIKKAGKVLEFQEIYDYAKQKGWGIL